MLLNYPGAKYLAISRLFGKISIPTKYSIISIPHSASRRTGYHAMKQQILLACGCRPWFSGPVPKLGDELYCVGHRKGSTRVQAVDWNFKCEQCRYGRYNLGCAQVSASVKASSHAIRRSHRVRVWCQSDHIVTETLWMDGTTRQLVLSDAPPF